MPSSGAAQAPAYRGPPEAGQLRAAVRWPEPLTDGTCRGRPAVFPAATPVPGRRRLLPARPPGEGRPRLTGSSAPGTHRRRRILLNGAAVQNSRPPQRPPRPRPPPAPPGCSWTAAFCGVRGLRPPTRDTSATQQAAPRGAGPRPARLRPQVRRASVAKIMGSILPIDLQKCVINCY